MAALSELAVTSPAERDSSGTSAICAGKPPRRDGEPSGEDLQHRDRRIERDSKHRDLRSQLPGACRLPRVTHSSSTFAQAAAFSGRCVGVSTSMLDPYASDNGSLSPRGSLPKILGCLYASGALVALVWTALPHSPDDADDVVIVMALLALALGAGLVRYEEQLQAWMRHSALALIQVVIGIGYVAEGDPSCDVRLFFLWATPYAALHFSVRCALGHVLWTSVVFVASLLLMPAGPHRTAAARPCPAGSGRLQGGQRPVWAYGGR